MTQEKKQNIVEIEQPTIREIDHKTVHPSVDQEWSLYNVNFATGENTYLSNTEE